MPSLELERVAFLQHASVDALVRDHNQHTHPAIKEFYDSLPTVYLDVDPSRILCAREAPMVQKVTQKAGIQAIDPFGTAQKTKRKAFRFLEANRNGEFVFYPGRLYLMRTRTFVTIPHNARYELKPFFSVAREDEAGGYLEELPLTTNMSAAILQPGDIARIAYEVINTSDRPLRVNLKDLLSQAYVVPLSTTPDVTGAARHGRFGTQLRDIRI